MRVCILYFQNGTSVLFVAAWKGHDEVVRILIQDGADTEVCVFNAA